MPFLIQYQISFANPKPHEALSTLKITGPSCPWDKKHICSSVQQYRQRSHVQRQCSNSFPLIILRNSFHRVVTGLSPLAGGFRDSCHSYPAHLDNDITKRHLLILVNVIDLAVEDRYFVMRSLKIVLSTLLRKCPGGTGHRSWTQKLRDHIHNQN